MFTTRKHTTTATWKIEVPVRDELPMLAQGTYTHLEIGPDDELGPEQRGSPRNPPQWEEHIATFVHDLRHSIHNVAIDVAVMEHRLEAIPEHHPAVARVRENLAYMQRVLAELLETAASEHIGLRPSHTELRSLLHRVKDRVAAEEDRDRVRIEAPEEVVADVDAHRIERVITKLLHNALVYAPAPAKIVMRLERHGTVARLSVIDGGRCLTVSEQSSVLDKYKRGASSEDTGSGIGLYICRRIVEAHGGRISLRSMHSRGSRIVVELPL